MTTEFDDLLSVRDDNLAVALDLARKGFPVLPFREWRAGEGEKGIRNWPEAASTDPRVVGSWWRKWPDAKVGIVTGERSGIAVLDLDRKNGVDGIASLAALGFSDLAALSPVRVRTPSGGWHLYFKNDPRLSTSAGIIGPGIDVRAKGGLIFAPGSWRDGRQYLSEALPLGTVELPDWPEALIPAEKEPCCERGATVPPVDFAAGELEQVLAEIPAELALDRGCYDNWFRLGAALYHQFNGEPQGMELWREVSTRGNCFDRKAERQIRASCVDRRAKRTPLAG